MTLTNPKPLGFAYGEILTSALVNSAFSQLPYAVDGNAGGTYAPSDPIIIGGDGLNVTGQLTASGLTTISGTLVTEGTASRICQVSLTASSIASGDKFQMTSVVNDAGYTVNTTDDTIAVPTTGIYLFALRLTLTNSQTNNPQSVSVNVLIDGASDNSRSMAGLRYSATNTDAVTVVGSGILEITDVADLITLVSGNSGTTSTTTNLNHLTLALLAL